MTDPELARETAEKIVPVAVNDSYRQYREEAYALILAAFARTEDARRVEWLSQQGRIDYCTSYWRPTDKRSLRSAIDAARGAADPMKETFAYLESPSEPASRAIPITAEIVVPWPCWLWKSKPMQRIDPLWLHLTGMPDWCLSVQDLVEAGSYTHYHPDQPNAPTIRPPKEGA